MKICIHVQTSDIQSLNQPTRGKQIETYGQKGIGRQKERERGK